MPTIGVADISFIRIQIIEKLLLNRSSRYTDALDGSDSEFAVKQEITDNILLADEILVSDILNTPGHGWRQRFMQFSADLASGAAVPDTIGGYGDVKVKNGSTYTFGLAAKSREEILRMIAYPSLYPSAGQFYFIEDGIVYTPADKAQVQYAYFTRTSACQSPQTAEAALIYGGLMICEKRDAASPLFQKYGQLFDASRPFVKAGTIIPPQELLEQGFTGRQEPPPQQQQAGR
jgi:hypothetical protein